MNLLVSRDQTRFKLVSMNPFNKYQLFEDAKQLRLEDEHNSYDILLESADDAKTIYFGICLMEEAIK